MEKKVNAWADISKNGKISIQIYTEIFPKNYLWVLWRNLWKKWTQWQEFFELTWDNNLIHTNNLTKEFYNNNKKHCKWLDWPAYSPDLNHMNSILEYNEVKVESNKHIKDFWSYFKSEKNMGRIKPRVY